MAADALAQEIGRLHGSLSAMIDRMEETRNDIREIRDAQATLKAALIASDSENRAVKEALTRMEGNVDKLQKQVDQLTTIKHKFGGIVIALTLVMATFVKSSFALTQWFHDLSSVLSGK